MGGGDGKGVSTNTVQSCIVDWLESVEKLMKTITESSPSHLHQIRTEAKGNIP